ncbi:MAG: hypothetical protein D8B47_03260 [Kingella sp. (in: b-proteobacteria)]|nr:MAG: hypothetical protein D8B47_03260 [Kingella sp. (in: b-proteobacteria)]
MAAAGLFQVQAAFAQRTKAACTFPMPYFSNGTALQRRRFVNCKKAACTRLFEKNLRKIKSNTKIFT